MACERVKPTYCIVCCVLFKPKMVLCVMQDGSVPEIVGEDGNYSVVRLRQPLADKIATSCDLIRDAVQGLIETYCHAFRVDFQLSSKAELPISKSCYMNLTCSANWTRSANKVMRLIQYNSVITFKIQIELVPFKIVPLGGYTPPETLFPIFVATLVVANRNRF